MKPKYSVNSALTPPQAHQNFKGNVTQFARIKFKTVKTEAK